MNLASKRVLVTGADGFIGSHLVETLVEKGAHVTALALYNSFNNWGWLESVPCLNDIQVITGDVRDPHFCLELTRNIDVVFHLAALIPIPYSYRAPSSYVDTNVVGTLNICQAALARNVSLVVHTSTSEVYGTAQYVPMDEKHPLNAQSPYSATKIGADAVAASLYNSFQLPVVIARPFNAYGPRQSARAVIPTIITQIASGKRSIKLGDTETTRDFTFVKDTCRGFAAIAEMEGGAGEVFHIGSNFEVSILQVFETIADIMRCDVRVETDPSRKRPDKSEVLRLWCSNQKLYDRTGFKPETGLKEGLQATVSWFEQPDNLRRYKTELYNV